MKKKTSIILFAVVLSCAGFAIGKQQYASGSYRTGKAALEAGNYDEAQKALHQAVKWDDHHADLLDLYLEASYETQNDLAVIQTAAKMETLSLSQHIQVIDSYERLTASCLEDNDIRQAVQLLKQLNEIYPSQKTTYQILSLQAGEDVTDENGITWNGRGQIVQIAGHGREISVTYRDQHFETIVNEKGKKIEGFDFSQDDTEYTLTLYDGIPPWQSIRYVYDEEGRVSEMTVESEGKKDQMTYTYHRNSVGRIERESQWHLADDTSSTWEYLYENGVLHSKNQMVRGVSQGNYVLYIYDEEGRIAQVQEYQNLINLMTEQTYTYDENGLVTRLEETKEGHTYVYAYTIEAFEQVYASVSEDGEIIADMYYVKGNGWISVERKQS